MNTRFGMYTGPVNETEFPGDYVVDAPEPALRLNDEGDIEFDDGTAYTGFDDLDFGYDDYSYQYQSFDALAEQPKYKRRIMTVPVGDCTGTTAGQGDVNIWGFACVYLIQPVDQQGVEAHVFGQLVTGCDTAGTFSMDPGTGPEPTKIILYKDPDNLDA